MNKVDTLSFNFDLLFFDLNAIIHGKKIKTNINTKSGFSILIKFYIFVTYQSFKKDHE